MSAIKGGVGGGRQHIDRDFKKREKRCLFTGSLPELQLISFRSVTQYVKCAHFAALKNFIREEEFFIIASFYTVTFMKEKKNQTHFKIPCPPEHHRPPGNIPGFYWSKSAKVPMEEKQ